MKINITHLYPEHLDLYGDKGNVASLKMRCLWRGIDVEVVDIEEDARPDLENTDILLLGGGSENAEAIVIEKLGVFKQELRDYVENGGVVLALCGGFEMLGRLGILDIETEKKKDRFIGNVMISCYVDGTEFELVGFENHGGRTNIKGNIPLGKVVSGNGNNGKDGTEGIIYKNVIGTYLHGPLLPKNPILADLLLETAIKRKHSDFDALSPLDDKLEKLARDEAKNIIENNIM